MASEPKKFRAEKNDEDSAIQVKTDMPEDPPKEIVKEELYKLPLGVKINFTIKSHLTDATLIIEGRKIYAGSDFLSIHSPFFHALLKGNYFAEGNMSEIGLKDVTYQDFHKMLQYLSDYSRVIKAEDVEILLSLGDRFDIKYLTDRVEEFMMKTKDFSVSEKLLLADKYRLMKLQVVSYDSISQPGEQLFSIVKRSPEFKQLSQSAKEVFDKVYSDIGRRYPVKKDFITSTFEYEEDRYYLPKVETVEEPVDGFIGTGLLAVRFDYSVHYHNSIDVAGLLWTVREKYDEDETFNLDDGLKYKDVNSITLVVNRHRPTSVEWEVKGYVILEMHMVHENTGEKTATMKTKYAFSFHNTNRVGCMKIDGFGDTDFCNIRFANITIYIEEISGVRKSPKYDFINSSEFSDAAFLVEGKKIHVNKQYLSTISPRFNEMFYDTDEVQLNVNYEELIEFLHWIYPTSGRKMTVTSIISIISVARSLGVTVIDYVFRNYLAVTEREVLLTEKMFLYFQLNFGEERWLTGSEWTYLIQRRWKGAYTHLKSTDLYAKMSVEKKLALADWIVDQQ